MCTDDQQQQQSKGTKRRLLFSAAALLIVGGIVAGVVVSLDKKNNKGSSSSRSSSSSDDSGSLQFFCTKNSNSNSSTSNIISICYEENVGNGETNDCAVILCCSATTGRNTTSLRVLAQQQDEDYSSYEQCLSSPLAISRCVEAGLRLPTNPNCPSLPFYAWPKTSVPANDSTLSIAAVGDILFEATLQRQAARYGSYAESWEAVAPLLRRADIAFGNHEGTASYVESIADDPDSTNFTLQDFDRGEQPLKYAEGGGASGVFYSGGPYLQFNYHPMLATDLASSGFDIVSTANNHCLDRGALGVNSTLNALDDAGVAHTGTRRSIEEPWHAILERNGWRTAWVACTDGTNFQRNRRDRHADLVLNCFTKRFTELVTTLAADPTIHAVVAVVHWGSLPPSDAEGDAARKVGYARTGFGPRGVVYQRQPDCAMRHWARDVAEAGAAVVLGMHPHVLHGWERFVTSYGRETLLIHSLGNFISHGGYLETKPPPAFLGRGYDSEVGFLLRRTSVLLQFGLRWNADNNWAEVACLSYVPLFRSLTDVGFVEPTLAAENLTTYEIHALPVVSSEQPAEYSFVADRFGPLRDYANGGGVYGGQAWEAALNNASGYAESCYPLSDAPVSNVDAQLYPSVIHRNDDGNTVAVATGYCLKCEPADGPDGCRWCEYKAYSYCAGPSRTKIQLGLAIPWDECLALVAQNANCSNYAYAGGDVSKCTCIRNGETCNVARSSQSQTVYVRQCGSSPTV